MTDRKVSAARDLTRYLRGQIQNSQADITFKVYDDGFVSAVGEQSCKALAVAKERAVPKGYVLQGQFTATVGNLLLQAVDRLAPVHVHRDRIEPINRPPYNKICIKTRFGRAPG